MKRIFGCILLLACVLGVCFNSFAQSGTSNKGTEFWTAYMDHVSAASPNGSQMILYITSDVNTSGTVTLADNSVAAIPYTVTANQVTFVPIPASAFLNTEGKFKKGIHITALKPVAVYAHIYASSVSGATLLLPVNNLGKNYTSINYTQISNSNPSYSTFAVIATEDNTTVEITPTAALFSGKPANTTFNVTLNKGEVYQGLSLTDLTGTKIKSISSSTGSCQRIAVFSGSSKIGIGCYDPTKGTNSQTLSSDNLFQQVYPTATWGKNFVTVSLKNRNYDVYRIVLSDPATNVTLNGALIPKASFTNNLCYEFSTTGASTNIISADKPIQAVQYTPTQNQAPNCTTKSESAAVSGGGDPEMIYLTPIEQGLDHVTLYSTGYFLILKSYINVVIPNSGVASFTLDGVSYSSSFSPVPNSSAYSYARIDVATGPNSPSTAGTAGGTHNIKSNVPFNAIAYGFGSAESYGYAAGTDLKNLNQYVVLKDPAHSDAKQTSGCVNVTYNLQVTTHQTTSIIWKFQDGTQYEQKGTELVPVSTQLSPDGSTTLYTYQYPSDKIYPNAGNYTVIASVFNPVADECGSYEDIQFNFDISEYPVANFTYAGTSCEGNTIKFTNTTDLKGAAVKTWIWDFDDGSPASNLQNPEHVFSAGKHDVKLTVINENGCLSNVAVKTIIINKNPTASFTYVKGCAGTPIAFTDTSLPTDGAITGWSWDFGDGTPASTLQSPTHTFAVGQDYTVKLTVTNANGCTSAPTPQTVTVYKLPAAEFTYLAEICPGIAQDFNDNSSTPDSSIVRYDWSFSDGAIAQGQFVSHAFAIAGPASATLTITNANGCQSVKTHNITVKEAPVAKFTYSTLNCAGEEITFTDASTYSGTISNWTWIFQDGEISHDQSPTHIYKTAGTYNVVLIVSALGGCTTASSPVPVHVNQLPTPDFSYSSTTCDGKSITFTDASIPNEGTITHWMWDFKDGSTPEDRTSSAPFTHVFKGAATYDVTLTLVNSTECTSQVIKPVDVHPLPEVSFTIPDICVADGTATFTNTSTIADHTEADFTYSWDFGDAANSAPGNLNTSSSKNGVHKYKDARDETNPYHVTLTITSKYGCVTKLTQDFVVNGSTPNAQFALDPSNTYCASNDVIFLDQSTVDIGKVVKLRWYYDLDNHPSDYEEFNTTTSPLHADKKYYHHYDLGSSTVPQTYHVKIVAFSGASETSCVNISAISPVTVNPDPMITLTNVPKTLCEDAGTVQIVPTPNSPDFVGQDSFSGKGISPDGLFDPQLAGPGTHRIEYNFIEDGSGCTYYQYFDVLVYAKPLVTVTPELLVLAGGKVQLKASATSPDNSALSYQWTPSAGLSRTDILEPEASPLGDTKYTLTVTSANGCPTVAYVNVKVLQAPVVPNTFTPNGDSRNDTWVIENLDTYPNATVEIFNRNGEKIYYSLGYPAPWDGRYKGANLPAGTYYYIINPKNGRGIISGYVAIIR